MIRKLVAVAALAVLLGAAAIVAHAVWALAPGEWLDWAPLLEFSLPAVVLTGLLVINLRLTGAPFRWLLLAAALALLALSLFAPPAIPPSALSLPMLAVLYWLDSRRALTRPNAIG